MIVIATPHRRYDVLQDALARQNIHFLVARSPDEMKEERLASLDPRYIFFPHWSWKIPPEIHEKYECVIFHMTDVPFGRGGSPLQNLIVRGFLETRLSALRCTAEMDAGPVYLKETLSLDGSAEDILRRAAQLMASMMLTIIKTEPAPVAQQGQPTIFKRRTPKDGDLRPLADTKAAYDYIRMLDADGYPPAFLDTDELRFEFSQASLDDDAVYARVKISKKPV